jgi:hypothetical protein
MHNDEMRRSMAIQQRSGIGLESILVVEESGELHSALASSPPKHGVGTYRSMVLRRTQDRG